MGPGERGQQGAGGLAGQARQAAEGLRARRHSPAVRSSGIRTHARRPSRGRLRYSALQARVPYRVCLPLMMRGGGRAENERLDKKLAQAGVSLQALTEQLRARTEQLDAMRPAVPDFPTRAGTRRPAREPSAAAGDDAPVRRSKRARAARGVPPSPSPALHLAPYGSPVCWRSYRIHTTDSEERSPPG